MNMPVITIEEIKYAVCKMENKKSTGGDEVAIEGIKLGGNILQKNYKISLTYASYKRTYQKGGKLR
jgi:hypothetical protein